MTQTCLVSSIRPEPVVANLTYYIVFNYNLSLLAFGLSAEAKLKTICWINNLSTLNSFLYKLMGSPRQCFKKVYRSSICFVLFVYE